MKKYDFEGVAIRSLRSVITTHWLSMMPMVRESGWRKSDLNPMSLLDYFGSLSLRSGYVLRAYERHCGPNSWGAVWALPSSMPFSDPKPNGNGLPARPDGALENTMDAIEGDGSPYSYLCASLLARELEHFGTLSPDSDWLNCFILGSDPWIDSERWNGSDPGNGSSGVAHALAGQGFTRDRHSWSWAGRQPNAWRPAVFMSQRTATVIFHAFSGVGRQRIITFEDHYMRGCYSFSRQEKPIANGPNGYVW